MLDNNVNKNQQIAFQTMPAGPQQNPVSMEAQVNPELLKENIQDTYVANRVAETTEDPKAMLYTAGIAVPAWFAIAEGMDAYARHSRGDFDKTIHGKIGRFGDKVSDTVKNSSFGKSSFANSLVNGYNSFKNFVKTKVIDKSRILRAFTYTPSRPELGMVREQAEGGIGFESIDCKQINEQFTKPLKNPENLVCYGGTKADIDKYKPLFESAKDKKAKAEVMQIAEFDVLSKNQIHNPNLPSIDDFKAMNQDARAKLLENIKAREWGAKDIAELKKVGENMADHMPRAFEMSANANPKMFAIMTGTEGTAIHRIFGRNVYASEVANKYAGFLGNKNDPEWQKVLKSTGYDKKVPQTVLGKGLTKYTNLVMEGATNRVAGGKLIAIAQAAYLADVIYKSATAEGGASEKAKSFAERFAEMLSFFICIPFALKLMHRIGGLQYAGMTKEQVAQYRKDLKLHNEKAMSGGYKTKLEWSIVDKQLKDRLNAGVKNPITKLAKKIGRIVTVGLEQRRPWDKADIGIMKDGKKVFRSGIGEKLKDLWRHPKFGMKQMAGYPMRIALGMFILLPMFNKIAVKTSHLIFGKPKKSLLDEGKEEETPQQKDQVVVPPQLQNNQNPQTQQTTQTIQQNFQSNGETNLLNQYKNGQTTTTTTTETKNNEPPRTYIPSPVGVQITGIEDMTAAEAAMKRADIAEQLAMQTLKMN